MPSIKKKHNNKHVSKKQTIKLKSSTVTNTAQKPTGYNAISSSKSLTLDQGQSIKPLAVTDKRNSDISKTKTNSSRTKPNIFKTKLHIHKFINQKIPAQTSAAATVKRIDLDNKKSNLPFNRFANSIQMPKLNTSIDKKCRLSTYPSSGLSPKEISFIISSCQTRWPQYLALKNLAAKAVREQNIFTVYGACKPVRQALVERGWVEKMPPNKMNLTKIKEGTLCPNEQRTELERLLLSSLVSKYPPNFIWRNTEDVYDGTICTHTDAIAIENKLRIDTLWTSKQGLCTSMKREYWFHIEDVAEVTGPRSYTTHDNGDVEDFVKDYKITACTSLLKWVISMVANERVVFHSSGKIATNVLVFALNRCKEYLFRKQNRDIDLSLSNISAGQWNTFLKKYYLIIGKEAVFQEDKENKLPLYLGYAKFLLREMYRYRPQLSCEGCNNIWIIKPTHNSRGRGIRLASKLGVITDIFKTTTAKYVIQKYVEEPLLIHDTKFDIRQYYLVTNTYPLTIWMYKDCYLKFSSQKYNLYDYHESIHLTNNAVQRKYKNCTGRHSDLPPCNMWHSDKYKHYLNSIGRYEVWDNIIYPGMKKSIIGIMLSCQDSMAVCKNRFELYGCDFILDKTYNPWLIEINSGPDLCHTTSVTAKICPAVLTDIIKVVIDHRHNKEAPTGKFECIYKQPVTAQRYVSSTDMYVRGHALPNSYFYRGHIPIRTYQKSYETIKKNTDVRDILKKIKRYYNIDSIMAYPDVDVISQGSKPSNSEMTSKTSVLNKKYKSFSKTKDKYVYFDEATEQESPTRSVQSEYKLSVAATVITMHFEELMDKLTSDQSNGTIGTQLSHTNIHTSFTQLPKIKSNDIDSQSNINLQPLTSMECIRIIPKTNSGNVFPFSRLDDGPSGKGSATDLCSNFFGDCTPKALSKAHSSKKKGRKHSNNLIEATSEMCTFFTKKEKEYLYSNQHSKHELQK